MQRNWIGRSTGAEVDFKIEGLNSNLTVFTTRPDTLFGATYMVIAPEHPLTDIITTSEHKILLMGILKQPRWNRTLDRTDLAKEKTGVFTGRYAINPVNKKQIPIWVADYVLTGYGTGAIMAVPAHDTRDFEFAQKFNLPIICIQDPDVSDPEQKKRILAGTECWTEDGKYINSSDKSTGIDINGLNKEAGNCTDNSMAWIRKTGFFKINYKIRDWLFSRQRYWGEPFRLIHWEDGEVTVMNDNELPLELPELENYLPGNQVSRLSPIRRNGWIYLTKTDARKKGNQHQCLSGQDRAGIIYVSLTQKTTSWFLTGKRKILDACWSLYRRSGTCSASPFI